VRGLNHETLRSIPKRVVENLWKSAFSLYNPSRTPQISRVQYLGFNFVKIRGEQSPKPFFLRDGLGFLRVVGQ
jgi:hypothetical protein